MSGIESSIARDAGLTPAQKEQIIADLRPIVASIDETGLREYLVSQEGLPETFIQNCQAVLNATVPAVTEVPTKIKNAIFAGFSRCAASLSNAAVYGNVTIESAQAGLGRVRELFGGIFRRPVVPAAVGEPAAVGKPAAVAEEDREAAVAIIDANINAVGQAIQQGVADRVAVNDGVGMSESQPELPPVGAVAKGGVESNDDSDMEGKKDGGRSRSRSRKRSASKRTRRKGKQPSKKNKRKSRRYVRRASSRKSRK
jgi:hypothetical protein